MWSRRLGNLMSAASCRRVLAQRAARAAATSTARSSPAALSSTPFTYLWPSVPPKLFASSTASLIATL